MADSSQDPQIRIGASIAANTGPGAAQVKADVDSVAAAAKAATDSSAQASQQAAGAATAATASLQRIKGVADAYGVSVEVAAHALESLGPAAAQATIGSNQLGEAIQLSRSNVAALGREVADTYGVPLQVAQRAISELGASSVRAGIGTNELGQDILRLRVEMGSLATAAREAAAGETDQAQAARASATATSAATTESRLATTASAEQAEQAERLNALMREHQATLMRSVIMVHRSAEGLKDLALGGRAASQGVMDLAEAAQYALGPEYAMYAAIAQVVLMAGVLATAHHRRAGEAKGAADAEKEAAEEVKDAWISSNDELKREIEAISRSKFWDQQLAVAKQVTDEIGKQAAALATVKEAEDKYAEAQHQLEIAVLNRREQEDLAGKSGDDVEIIKQKYAALRDESNAKNEQDRNAREAQHEQDHRALLVRIGEAHQAESAGAAVDAQRAATAFHQRALDFARQISDNNPDAKDDFQAARDRMQQLALQQQGHAAGQADIQTGRAIPALTVAEQIELNNLQNGGVEARRQRQQQAGHSFYDDAYERAKKERDDIEKATGALSNGSTIKGMNAEETADQVRQWTDRAKALGDFMKQVESYNELLKQSDSADYAATKAYNDNQKFQADNQSQIQASDINLRRLGIVGQSRDQDAAAKQQEDANAQQALAAKEEREARDAALDARVSDLERLQASSPSPALTKELGDAKAEQERNKGADQQAGLTLGNVPPLDPALAAKQAHIEDIQAQVARINREVRNNLLNDPEIIRILNRQLVALAAQLQPDYGMPNNGPGALTDDEAYRIRQHVGQAASPNPERDLAGADQQRSDAAVHAEKARSEAEAQKQQMEAQRKEVEQLKRQVGAMPHGSAFEPMIKQAEASGSLTQETSLLQSILAGHVRVVADALVHTQAQLSETRTQLSQVARSAGQLQRGQRGSSGGSN
jgi:polyhydroxyalkanoate synthesis regulator phasin